MFFFSCFRPYGEFTLESMTENEIGTKILNAAFKVHSSLGPGLLESCYEKCLAFELMAAGLNTRSQVHLPINYLGNALDAAYRLDLLIEDSVIVEVKSVESIDDIHLAQLLTYLKLSGKKLGYLLNFNVTKLKFGIRRVVFGLED